MYCSQMKHYSKNNVMCAVCKERTQSGCFMSPDLPLSFALGNGFPEKKRSGFWISFPNQRDKNWLSFLRHQLSGYKYQLKSPPVPPPGQTAQKTSATSLRSHAWWSHTFMHLWGQPCHQLKPHVAFSPRPLAGGFISQSYNVLELKGATEVI